MLNSELASRLPAQDGLSEGGHREPVATSGQGPQKVTLGSILSVPHLGKGDHRAVLPTLLCGFVRFR